MIIVGFLASASASAFFAFLRLIHHISTPRRMRKAMAPIAPPITGPFDLPPLEDAACSVGVFVSEDVVEGVSVIGVRVFEGVDVIAGFVDIFRVLPVLLGVEGLLGLLGGVAGADIPGVVDTGMFPCVCVGVIVSGGSSESVGVTVIIEVMVFFGLTVTGSDTSTIVVPSVRVWIVSGCCCDMEVMSDPTTWCAIGIVLCFLTNLLVTNTTGSVGVALLI
jgi:hypothetical protein